MITLTYNDTTIELPDDLLWPNKYKWSAVKQEETVLNDGSIAVEADAQQTGRLITIMAGDNFGWIKRSDLDQVKVLEAQAGLQMTLTMHDGVERNVVFTGDRLTAEPVIEYAEDAPDDYFIANYYFMEL